MCLQHVGKLLKDVGRGLSNGLSLHICSLVRLECNANPKKSK
jgi:hypothetical protein